MENASFKHNYRCESAAAEAQPLRSDFSNCFMHHLKFKTVCFLQVCAPRLAKQTHDIEAESSARELQIIHVRRFKIIWMMNIHHIRLQHIVQRETAKVSFFMSR